MDTRLTNLKKSWGNTSEDIKEIYGNHCYERFQQRIKKAMSSISGNTSEVISAMQHAVRNIEPQIRYRCSWNVSFLLFLNDILPFYWREFIENFVDPVPQPNLMT